MITTKTAEALNREALGVDLKEMRAVRMNRCRICGMLENHGQDAIGPFPKSKHC